METTEPKRTPEPPKNVKSPMMEVNQMGEHMVVCFSKAGLQAMLQHGKSIPLRLVDGDKRVSLVFMRDRTFRDQMRQYKKAEEKAKANISDMAQQALDNKKGQEN